MEQARPAESLALATLREIRGWGQKNLAAEAGLKPDTISLYERKRCSREQLHRLGAVLGFTPDYIDRLLVLLQEGQALLARPGHPTRDEAATWEVQEIAAQEARRYEEFLRASLLRFDQAADALLERRAAPRLLRWLRRHPEERWRTLIDTDEQFWSWGLAELLCEESVDAARSDPQRGERIAELALAIAPHLPGSEGRRARTAGYAWAFIGNARRVFGRLRFADEAFARSERLFAQGGPNEPPLDASRPLTLEASLRREQRRLPEALALLDRAFRLAGSAHEKGRILLKRSKTYEEMDDYHAAIAALHEAAPFVQSTGDLQHLFSLRFNLLDHELHTAVPVDAPSRLTELRELAVALESKLHFIRLRWLEGRLAAATGEIKEAEQAFRWVGDELAARNMHYDAALVLVELAVLLLEQSRTREVQALASQLEPIFRSEGVHREACASLQLFYNAAVQEQASAAMVRRLVTFLRRARSNPDLRFEDWKPISEAPPSPRAKNSHKERG